MNDVGPHDPLSVRRDDAGASDTTVSDSSAHGSDAAFGDSELRDAHTPTKPSTVVETGIDADVGEDAAPPHAADAIKNTTRGAVRATRFFAHLYTSPHRQRGCRVHRPPRTALAMTCLAHARIGGELPAEEPPRRKDVLMAHSNGRKSKREYGTGCLIQRGRRWAIRWREPEIGPDGTRRQVLRYESLGSVTRQEARALLAQRLASRTTAHAMRSCVPFKTLAEEWRKTVVPMYKHSTQKNHRHVLDKHLIPWFGDRAMHEITRQEVQGYVAHLVRQDYAPRSIDHIHDVLSAVLRTAVR